MSFILRARYDIMAARAFWKGYLQISLVSVPVAAFTTASRVGGRIALHQLHDECKSRIKHVKTCPIHGEVSQDELGRRVESPRKLFKVHHHPHLQVIEATPRRRIS